MIEETNHDVMCMDAAATELATPELLAPELTQPEPAFSSPPFLDRTDAGKALARLLRPYELDPDIVVVALPRGGVPLAYTVARTLHTPLSVCVVRKLGVPGHPDLAMGAIAPGEICVMNPAILEQFRVSREVFDRVAEAEAAELRRLELTCRTDRQTICLTDRTVILVDDGVATGATMRAATAAMRQLGAERIVIATHVCTQALCRSLSSQADEIHCLRRPQAPTPISATYEQFPLVQDDEVRRLLRRAAAIPVHT